MLRLPHFRCSPSCFSAAVLQGISLAPTLLGESSLQLSLSYLDSLADVASHFGMCLCRSFLILLPASSTEEKHWRFLIFIEFYFCCCLFCVLKERILLSLDREKNPVRDKRHIVTSSSKKEEGLKAWQIRSDEWPSEWHSRSLLPVPHCSRSDLSQVSQHRKASKKSKSWRKHR